MSQTKVPTKTPHPSITARQELARRELARRKLIHFTKLTYPNYSPGIIHYDLCERLERFSRAVIAKKSPRLMVLMPPRHGKALSDDTLVPTMKGFKPHGELTTDDVLIGARGQALKILAVSPPTNDIDCRVHFRNGDYVDCHRNHEWGVFYRPRVQAHRVYKVVETHEMLAHFHEIGAWLSDGVTKTRSPKPYHARFFMPEPQARNMPYPLQQMWVKRPKPPNTLENFITMVEEIRPVSGRCVQVDSYDGLYCVTTSMLLTHNSELVSIRFPAWHLGHHPDHEFIVAGYALELPMKFSRKAREILRDPVYKAIFPESILATDSQSVESWNTTLGGGYRSASVTGGLTGHGAAILTIDDPFKNLEEADSAQIRDKVWDWYQSAAYTRLAPGGGVLCVQTRWSDDDLAGRLLQAQLDPEMDQWEVVSYPAISERYEYVDASTLNMHRHPAPLPLPSDEYPDTVLFRSPDESLHPERFPIEMLRRIRSNLQPRIWSALYQQNPIPDEGLYFKKEWFRTHPSLPQYEGCRIITAWDFAIGEKQQNDWTVGVSLLQDHNDVLYLLDVVRFKGDTFMILQEIIRVIKKYRQPQCVTPPGDYILGLEDGQIFKTLRPLLEAELIAERLPTTLNVLPTLTDKMARARSLQAYLQRGRFVLPPAAEYDFVTPFVNELLRFPGGAHDDQIDAAAHAVRMAVDCRPIPRKDTTAKTESWRDKLHDIINKSSGTSHMSA